MAWLNSDEMYHLGALFTIAQIFTEYPQIHWLQGYHTGFDKKTE